MAKKKKKKREASNVPNGYKCFQKSKNGSLRFPNRIIKPGQIFWIDPDAIPEVFMDQIKEVPSQPNAVIVSTNVVPKEKNKPEPVRDKFEVKPAVNDEGSVVKKGKKWLYNVVASNGDIMNAEPILKGEAIELQEALSS